MKVTKKHVEQYKRIFAEYQAMFGLAGWHIYFENRESDANGWLGIQGLSDRVATLGLATDIDASIRFIAKHEALELLLGPLQRLAESRYVTEEQIDEARHVIIRTLEKIIP